ncbi:MAG TPA: hypothetical protein VEH53_01810 [archaeon]|nr:hypothetical protein [archaeon]
MWPDLMRRSRQHWAVTILLPGVILVLAVELPWLPGPTTLPSRSTLPTQREATPTWPEHIRRIDAALAQGALQAAESHWLVAHLEAMRSHTWEAWIAVGDAALRLGEATGLRTAHLLRARYAYGKTLLIAQEAKSQAGVLAAADAFAALGDQALADELRALARTLPAPGS